MVQVLLDYSRYRYC